MHPKGDNNGPRAGFYKIHTERLQFRGLGHTMVLEPSDAQGKLIVIAVAISNR